MCYFHFLQALRKHLRDKHILTLLATNAEFASFIHLFSIPFPTCRQTRSSRCTRASSWWGWQSSWRVTIQTLSQTWATSRNGCPTMSTWVEQRQDCSRGSGLFPLVQWTQHDSALQLWPRTNNSSEGSDLFFIVKSLLVLGLTPYIP